MEGSSPEGRAPSGGRRRWRLLAVVLAVLVVASTWIALEILGPRTIREVFEMRGLRPGTEIALEGTISGVRRETTGLGPAVYLELDGYKGCEEGDGVSRTVRGDPAIEYRVGDRFRTNLRFEAFVFNGDAGVWSRDLVCPFPGALRGMARVWDAVSLLGGMMLVYNGTDGAGWSRYEIGTPTGAALRLEVLPVTLRKSLPVAATHTAWGGREGIDSAARWDEIAGVQYVAASGLFGMFPIVDEMDSLASPSSRNGTLRFVDANADGFADDDDHVDVRLPPQSAPTAYDAYMLQIGESGGAVSAYIYGGRYIVNGAEGPLERLPASRTDRSMQLLHRGDVIGANVTTTLEVGRVRFGEVPPLVDAGYVLSVDMAVHFGSISDLPTVLPGGLSVAFVDAGTLGRLDPGDRLTIGGLENRSRVSFQILDQAAGNLSLASIQWIAGHGALVGRLPEFSLAARGSGPFYVDATVPFWHPELALNLTVRATLTVGATVVLSGVALRNGTLGPIPGGNLSFLDADGDEYLSDGDSFTLDGDPGSVHELAVEALFGAVRRTAIASA